MALNQVGARIEGDVYQGMFFWYQASSLLIEDGKATSVILEHDVALGVDDVSVLYDVPGIVDAGRYCSADFFQVKYHVDSKATYSSDNLIDPSFIKATHSLLQSFYNAYFKLYDTYPWFRLHLISNWRWNSDDNLAKSIRECNYSLPDKFFSSSSGSVLGVIRENWRAHLGINETIFEDFARRLRLGCDYFGRGHFQEVLYDRLGRVGLRTPAADSRINPYDSLYQQFVMDRTNKFTRERLLDLCRKEGLLSKSTSNKSNATIIGIRSFMRFAERIEDETSTFVCVAGNFDGRYIRDSSLWTTKVIPDVRVFLNNPQFRGGEYHLLLDCHSSIAFLAGYELDQKSGASVYPVQKGGRNDVWKPSGNSPPEEWKWNTELLEVDPDSTDIVVAISITHDISSYVEHYLKSKKVLSRVFVRLYPESGIRPSSIAGADHAIRLAELAMQEIVRLKRNRNCVIHIFAAAPNGFMFFLGKYRSALGKIQLYEFDFDGEQGGTYAPSFQLPFSY